MVNAIKKVHFVGVGGVGMGSLAEAMALAGYEVTGSDGKLYDPMKTVLQKAKIQLFEGFEASRVTALKPDLVVIGNVVRKENPEAAAWIAEGTLFSSFPEAVRRFVIGDRRSIVCAGTHGKTTTTSWISFLLTHLGVNPSYLIGGVPLDLPTGCQITNGEIFVGEGDEYDSAFFDKGPKFLHYNPSCLVLANIEFDHADIYRDLDHVKSSFRKLVALLPGDGVLVARYDDENVMEMAQLALCPVQTFGMGGAAMWRVGALEESPEGVHFEVAYKGRKVGRFLTPLFGDHSLMNLLSGIAVAASVGLSLEKVAEAVPLFRGARRRQEILATTPCVLIDDFAHHPTEVRATLSAVRRRYPNRKIWALFEPRSATARRAVHQEDYASAFDSADQVLIASPFKAGELAAAERFSSGTLVEALNAKGRKAQEFSNTDAILEVLAQGLKKEDVIVVMSNGEFDKIQGKIQTQILPLHAQ